MKIQTQISLYLGPFLLIIISTIFVLNYFIVHHSLTENANLELKKTEQNMHRAVQVLLRTAISNYLRGITDKNIEFIEEQYAAYKLGKITESAAKDAIQIHFNLQTVGTNGYLVAVKERNTKLYLDLHPFLPRQECTETEGCRLWVETRNGYIEYNWKNPADNSYRKKAAYLREFPEWNWIVGASSYLDEFVNLVDIEELGDLIRPVRINTSGYFFVFDEKGTILIHPEVKDLDRKELVNSKGENILQLLKDSKDGYLTYLWKNPSETREQLRYAFIDKLEGYNWYLVATGYLDEVYEPIQYLKMLTIIMVVLTGSALFFIIYRLSRALSNPLYTLKKGVDHFYDNRSPFIWLPSQIDEINVLGKAFAQMSSELHRSLAILEEKNEALKVSEQEIEQNRLFLDSIINSMPSIIIGVDPHLTVTQWNRQVMHITGLSQPEVQGRSLFSVFPEVAEYEALITESIAKNIVQVHPYSHTDIDGKTRYQEITVYPLVVPVRSGAVIRIDNVTERVEMEQRLRQSQKMDAIGQLAGGIAHDFNNMLSGIVGSAELLRMRVDAKDQKLVKIISEASGRAGELIQKLLAFSRKETIAFAPVDMHVIITDTLEFLVHTLDKRITLTSSLQAQSGMVMGDWSQLHNSLLNIGINSGHAMPKGGTLSFATATVTLNELYCSQSTFDLLPGTYLQITIHDTGCGIAKENLKRIFEPFFTTREISKGTGLGLAAVYGAIQQHKGAITVNSEINNGTEFCIYLPTTTVTGSTPQPTAVLVHGEGGILVVDDEPVVRTTARKMLERLGYTVFEAENGKEGLEAYQQHMQNIDIVLLDMVMPIMDGTDCFEHLREMNPEARVIICSGFTRDADLSNMKDKGLCALIRKPYSMSQLSQVIDQVMQLKT